MKYFIDTEFIERSESPQDGVHFPHAIDLISIGIVSEDGREYYAINNNCNFFLANEWVNENVIKKLPDNWIDELDETQRNINKLYKSKIEIAVNIKDFIGDDPDPIFYAYYADYDWVVFCSLFGSMMDLPKGFPMYCRDLKQTLDEVTMNIPITNPEFSVRYIREASTFSERLIDIKGSPEYPIQKEEHNALCDARWNKQLYDFLQTISL